MKYTEKSIVELHGLLKSGEITPAELLAESLEEIHALQDRCNAFVTIIDDAEPEAVTDSLLSGEQARIEKEMKDFEEHIWAEPVDSVELARQDSIAQAAPKKKGLFRKKSSSTTTASKEKASKSSEKKAKSSGSSTPRVSVRRQRH